MYFTPFGLKRLVNKLNCYDDSDSDVGVGSGMGDADTADNDSFGGYGGGGGSDSSAGIDAALDDYFSDLDNYADVLSSNPDILQLALMEEEDYFKTANTITKAIGMIGVVTANPGLIGLASMGKIGLMAAEGLMGLTEKGLGHSVESSKTDTQVAASDTAGQITNQATNVTKEVDFDYQAVTKSAGVPLYGRLNKTKSLLDAEDKYGTYEEAIANLSKYKPDYY